MSIIIKMAQYAKISDIKNNDGSTTTHDTHYTDDNEIQDFDKTSIWYNLISKFMEKV
jgi:hypothetical protein